MLIKLTEVLSKYEKAFEMLEVQGDPDAYWQLLMVLVKKVGLEFFGKGKQQDPWYKQEMDEKRSLLRQRARL